MTNKTATRSRARSVKTFAEALTNARKPEAEVTAPETAAAAAAPEAKTGRAPTAAEIVESADESAVAHEPIARVQSIEEAAQEAFNNAANNTESEIFKGVSYLALRLCGQQMRKTLSGGLIDPAVDSFVFNQMLHARASTGRPVWRKSADELAAIMALDDAGAKAEALVAYAKSKGRKLVAGLEDIRTYGFRLASYMRDNHAAAMVECAAAITADAAIARWDVLISGMFGTTFSGLADNLDARLQPSKDAAKAKREATKAEAEAEDAAKAAAFAEAEKIKAESYDPVAAALEIVATMTNEQAEAFAYRFKAELELRGMMRPRGESANDAAPAPLTIEAEAA